VDGHDAAMVPVAGSRLLVVSAGDPGQTLHAGDAGDGCSDAEGHDQRLLRRRYGAANLREEYSKLSDVARISRRDSPGSIPSQLIDLFPAT
jgi:hypothetical protein